MTVFEKLKSARRAYPSNPIMSDREYDDLLEDYLASPECKQEERIFLLSPYEFTSIESARTTSMDFSITSVKTLSDAIKLLGYATLDTDEIVLVGGKIDGLRGNVTYTYDASEDCHKRGPVVPRSNEFEFHDVVQNKFPLTIKLPKGTFEPVHFTTEIYVLERDLKEISFKKNYEYTAPLNAAVSLSRTGFGYYDDDIETTNLLRIAVHRVMCSKLKTKQKEIQFINALGMHTVPHKFCKVHELPDVVKYVRNDVLEKSIPTDGIVIYRNGNTQESLSLTSGKNTYSDMVAYKPPEWTTSIYEATVIGLRFDDQGQKYNAKILVDPVKTREGRIVREVNGHSLAIISSMGIREGSLITFRVESNNHIELERGK